MTYSFFAYSEVFNKHGVVLILFEKIFPPKYVGCVAHLKKCICFGVPLLYVKKIRDQSKIAKPKPSIPADWSCVRTS